ncbi:MFS transporter [Brevibacterium aurantiacum]|uniref:Transmembrane secretion effector n=1 Tax=Brevibacterium aurantiacum TaxID=273384 RepID=A0A2H1I7H2_BREAU|nr:MFS transporter [Brevibacterium aurantiacum]SMX71128.1 Transmembrane secretion effector [Brevibacterium aurantiacum]
MSLGRSFRVLWGANAASNLADGLAFVSIPLLATSLTDDPRWIAGLSTLYALVRLLVALPIGVWVDRVDRRLILIVANILRGVAVLALAICVHLGIGGLVLLYAAYAVIEYPSCWGPSIVSSGASCMIPRSWTSGPAMAFVGATTYKLLSPRV